MKNDNELIAQFMGMRYRRSAGPLTGEFYDEVKQTLNANWQSTHWHKSWDWLMPVVEKIESLGYMTVASQNEWNGKQYINIITGVGIIAETVDNPSKFMASDKIKIKAWYKAAVEFIKWYNENKS